MKTVWLTVGCLLALAALAAAKDVKDSSKCFSPPPNGTPCPANQEFRGQVQKGKRGSKTIVGSCQACPAGQYTPAKKGCCEPCKNGVIYTDPAGVSTCNKCKGGATLYPLPGKPSKGNAATCMCRAGSQAKGTDPIVGISGCQECPAGTFNAAPTISTSACQACPADSAAPKTGSKSCVVCATLNLAASADLTNCICQAGFRANVTAESAPENAESGDGQDDDGDDGNEQGKGKGKGKGKRTNTPGGRRLSAVEVGAAAAKPPAGKRTISSDDDYKFPTCAACDTPSQNDQANVWPVCCAATYVYNANTTQCDATVCYDGATLENGACACNDGAAWDADNLRCDCGSANVVWDAGSKSCTCPNNSTWDAVDLVCNCTTPFVWDAVAGDCVCPTGTTFNSTTSSCDCTNGGTFNSTDGTCN